MKPREFIKEWVDSFNTADAQALAAFYHKNAINQQVNAEPVVGRAAIFDMFKRDFARTIWCVL